MERELKVSARIDGSPDRVIAALRRDAGAALLGQTGDAPHVGRISIDLGHGANVSQRVMIELGPVEVIADGATCAATFNPVAHARVVPRFRGHVRLVADGDQAVLELDGHYQPPLGRVGAVGDEVVGHHVARRALEDFAHALAIRLSHAAAQEGQPYPAPPEVFIG